MSTHLQDKLERIQQIIANLAEESVKGNLVVVEGKKDAEALQELGINCEILAVKSGGKSFLEVAAQIDKFSVDEVILLLDFDRRGKEGTLRLARELERLRINYNDKYWRVLFGLLGTEVQCVESLPSYLETLKNKALI